jgi:hypothetical protein
VLSGDDPFDEATMLDDGHGHGFERAQAADPCTASGEVGTDERGTVPAEGTARR